MRVINVSCCCHGENKHLFCNGGGSVWGKNESAPCDAFEREEKFNESREREEGKNARTNTAAVDTSETEKDKKKKKKRERVCFRERFKESEREREKESFLSAFRPQDALVFHRKTEG